MPCVTLVNTVYLVHRLQVLFGSPSEQRHLSNFLEVSRTLVCCRLEHRWCTKNLSDVPCWWHQNLCWCWLGFLMSIRNIHRVTPGEDAACWRDVFCLWCCPAFRYWIVKIWANDPGMIYIASLCPHRNCCTNTQNAKDIELACMHCFAEVQQHQKLLCNDALPWWSHTIVKLLCTWDIHMHLPWAQFVWEAHTFGRKTSVGKTHHS